MSDSCVSLGITVGAGHGSASVVLGFLERFRILQAMEPETTIQEDSGYSGELYSQFFSMLDILVVVSVCIAISERVLTFNPMHRIVPVSYTHL